ncbi:MAG: 23S rRNA (adenine(2503)-C(2))-methyltransferase RlmN [Planctomycetes bacterium]|nr:23S rRNA (adenine(2503)-C(2))-methyltransferase RlmN [Planctomycetota bacterium]
MDVYGWTRAQAEAWATSIGLPAYRGEQLLRGVYRADVRCFAEIPGWPRELGQRLDAAYRLPLAEEVEQHVSSDGTTKSLLRYQDGALVECVSIPTPDRHTVCVSTQVGCPVGCSFCASGLAGVERNLRAAEIVWQVLHHHRRRRVTHVVFMGSGEPFLNYDAVIQAIRVLGEPLGLGLGRRRITVSTSGVPMRIRQFARDEPQVTLALSLHAADDATRSRLVPLNRRWPLAEVLAAMRDYASQVGRRPTLEYVLLADANMSRVHAEQLAATARALHAHINLIPYNPVADLAHVPPERRAVAAFASMVRRYGGHATVRRPRGCDIAAACGQLRRQSLALFETSQH